MERPVLKTLLSCAVVVILVIATTHHHLSTLPDSSGAPPNGIPESEAPPLDKWQQLRAQWQRPTGPPKVALQVGHWKNSELPSELESLIGNTGASGGGHTEVATNLDIAHKTAVLLEAQGVVVDILPATIPPNYWADAFIAIHADGSTDRTSTGFKIAAPWRDLTGKAGNLVMHMENKYREKTKLSIDPNITRNMRGYYAFAWWRYEHSIHPMTTAAIVETGFITNPQDRKIIVDQPHVVSQALADGILQYLESEGLLS